MVTHDNDSDEQHPLLQYLPSFTCSKDRAVVLNLLCNVCGLCYDGFSGISCRTEEAIQLLAEEVVCSNENAQLKIECKDQHLFAIDAQKLLGLAARKHKEGMRMAEISVRWACMNFFFEAS